jgi:hypothetical protein
MRDGRIAFALSLAPVGLRILPQRLPTDKSWAIFENPAGQNLGPQGPDH